VADQALSCASLVRHIVSNAVSSEWSRRKSRSYCLIDTGCDTKRAAISRLSHASKPFPTKTVIPLEKTAIVREGATEIAAISDKSSELDALTAAWPMLPEQAKD